MKVSLVEITFTPILWVFEKQIATVGACFGPTGEFRRGSSRGDYARSLRVLASRGVEP